MAGTEVDEVGKVRPTGACREGPGPWPYPGPTGPLELRSSGLCPLAEGDLGGHGTRLSPGVASPSSPRTFKGALHALSSLPLPSDGNAPA